MIIVPASLTQVRKRVTGKVWTLLHSEDYNHGAEGTVYTSGPASGWTHSGDFAFSPRLSTTMGQAHSIRFPTQAEVGGSNNAYYRVQLILAATYFANNSCTTEFRMDGLSRVPNTGGFARQDGGGAGVAQAGLCTFGNGTRWHTIGVRTATTLGIWINNTAGDAAGVPLATAATTFGTMTGTTAGTWYPFSYRIKMSATVGYVEVWWNSLLVAQYTGNTVFAAGSNTGIIGLTYVTHLAGGTASNNDLNNFGGMTNTATYK